MKKNATIEIKQYAANHKKQGKTLTQIQQYLQMKGYDVCIETVSRWIKEVSEIKESNSDCSRYMEAMRYQNMKQKLFERARVGCSIVAKVEKCVETEDGKTLTKNVEEEMLVKEKYTYFLICTDGINKFCIDKMDIVSV